MLTIPLDALSEDPAAWFRPAFCAFPSMGTADHQFGADQFVEVVDFQMVDELFPFWQYHHHRKGEFAVVRPVWMSIQA